MILRALGILLFLVLTSCNSSVNEGLTEEQTSSLDVVVDEKGCTGADCTFCELPWGGQLASGESLENLFSKEIVACQESCTSFPMKVTCKAGQLEIIDLATNQLVDENTPVFNQCYKQRCHCEHFGSVVEDGTTVDLFPQATTSCNQKCEPRQFQCNSGTLIDVAAPNNTASLAGHPYDSCRNIPCSQCTTPWGQKIAHLGTVRAYKTESVACGENCNGEYKTLTCNNGSLTGADLAEYKFKTCNVVECKNCELPSGDAIAHNSSVYTYAKKIAACNESCYTDRARLTCKDGVITGGEPSTYQYTSCQASTQCARCTICGSSVTSGGSRTCYKNSSPQTCGLSCLTEAHTFSCENGIISKEDNSVADTTFLQQYNRSSCNELSACSQCELSDGRKVLDGKKVTFFKSSRLTCGEQCFSSSNAVTLTCSNGSFANKALYSDFNKLTCEADCTGTDGDNNIGRIEGEGGGAPRQLCRLPWGTAWVTHNTRVPAFSQTNVSAPDKCEDHKKIIKCDGYRGLWTGGVKFIYQHCTER